MNKEISERIDTLKKGNIPDGYKKSAKVGIIPEEWDERKFKECVTITNGQVNPNIEPYKNMKHIGLSNIEKMTGRLLYTKLAKEEDLISGKYYFDKDTVLYGKIRPELGKVLYVDFPGICSADIYPLKPKNNMNVKYLLYSLLDKKFYEFAVSISKRTGMPKVNREDISTYTFALPRNNEQKKITKILSTWDKAIELKEKLLEEKQKQKKGLMERLLTRKVRLKGFEGKWRTVLLGKVLEFIKKEPLINPQDYNLLTVKLHVKGIEATGKKPNTTEKGRPYYLREPNELLIGRQNFHNGGIGIVPENMKGYIASNAISSLSVLNGDLKFYYYYLSNESFYKKIDSIVGGTGQKEISESMMKKLKLTIPITIEEQKAIAKVLSTADKEIDLLENEIEALKQQKKGLMQLLLTGIVRVKCD